MTAFSTHEHTASFRRRRTNLDLGILARCRTTLLHARAFLPGVGPAFTQGDVADIRILHNPHRQFAPATYVKATIEGRTFTECTIVVDLISKEVRFLTPDGWHFDIRGEKWSELCGNAERAFGRAIDLGVTYIASRSQ